MPDSYLLIENAGIDASLDVMAKTVRDADKICVMIDFEVVIHSLICMKADPY
jgi:hypothetical protein